MILSLPTVIAFAAGRGHLTNETLNSTFFCTLLVAGTAIWFYNRQARKKAIATNNYLARISRESESGPMGKSVRLVTPFSSLMAYSITLAGFGYLSGPVIMVAGLAVIFICYVSYSES